MRRFLVLAMIFGVVSFAQAEMPGASLLKSIPFLNKSDSKNQEKTTETSNESAQKNEGSAPPAESLGSSLLKSLPFFNKSDSSKQPTGTQTSGSSSSGSGSKGGDSGGSGKGGSGSGYGGSGGDGGSSGKNPIPITAKTPQEFMALMPPLPMNICTATEEGKAAFHNKIDQIKESLSAELMRMRQEEEKVTEELQPTVEKNMAAKSGFSEADVQKLKSKKMSKEEKQAIANKALQEKVGISMDEVQKLKKMDKDAKKDWAQAYGTTQMASGAYDSPEAKAEQQHSKELLNKIQEVNQLLEKTDIRNQKGFAQLLDFGKKELPRAGAMKSKEIDPREKEFISLIGVQGTTSEARRRQLISQLKSLKSNYCNEFGGKYRAAIRDLPATINNLFPDYTRLERAQDELFKLQTGADKSPAQPGMLGLGAVGSYANEIDTVYSFDLRTYEIEMQ